MVVLPGLANVPVLNLSWCPLICPGNTSCDVIKNTSLCILMADALFMQKVTARFPHQSCKMGSIVFVVQPPAFQAESEHATCTLNWYILGAEQQHQLGGPEEDVWYPPQSPQPVNEVPGQCLSSVSEEDLRCRGNWASWITAKQMFQCSHWTVY